MEGRFNFNPLDLSTVSNFELSEGLLQNTKPVPLTAVGEEEAMLEEPLVTKSSLAPSTSYEISFEKGFMGEHEAVFAREL